MTRESFLSRLDFEPDAFQSEAFAAIDGGDNVLVAAPTSSGKTLVAEYAIATALARGVRVFYTTPIKALSNQKFTDLCRWLGHDSVGLLTGDNVIRADAAVVVMTTEVLRNMIYSGSQALSNLGYVVLDEVHYLQDNYRGPVWEEVIIQSPPGVSLIGLSATVSNADELSGWIADVRGSCRCIVEPTRPVELHPRLLVNDRAKNAVEDFALLRGDAPNDEVVNFIQRHSRGPRRRGKTRLARPRRVETIDHLFDAKRLPAIFFIFSRKGCEEAVQQVVREGIAFLDEPERERVNAIFEEHTRELSGQDLRALDSEHFLAGLHSGVGAHHAGMIPPFKETVEHCFAAGLLQVVFATETLALGINMPARSVVIEQLSRFRGEGHVLLTPGDFAQLTGRAGRRGIDKVGYAYVLWSPYVDIDEAASIAASKEFELRSVFRPTYNMAANLVATRTEQGAIELLQQSFAQYQSNRAVVGLTSRLSATNSELRAQEERYLADYGNLDAPAAEEPSKARGPVPRSRPHNVEAAIGRLRPGDIIREDPRRDRTSLVVIGVSQRKNVPTRIRVVTPRGKSMVLTAADFGSVPAVVDNVELPSPYEPSRRDFQKQAGSLLRRIPTSQQGQDHAVFAPEPPRPDQPDRGDRVARYRQIERSRHQQKRLKHRLDRAGDGLGQALGAIVEVLRELDYVAGWKLTDKGRLLRGIFNENDLWVAEVVDTGVLDGLDPARLAAVVSGLTYQRRGPGAAPPVDLPDALIRERLGSIKAIARRLSRTERAAGLAETPDPEPGFAPIAHAWALGIELEELLADEDMTGGDFVRNVRQLVDLLRQISEIGPNGDTRATARKAVGALDRGLVAASARVAEDDQQPEANGP